MQYFEKVHCKENQDDSKFILKSSVQDEIVIQATYNLEHVICRLSKILYIEEILQRYGKREGHNTLKLIEILNSESNAIKIMQNLEQYLTRKTYITRCDQVYAEDKIEKAYGNKAAEINVYGHNGIVVGFSGRCLKYRVDYDPRKKLHISLISSLGVQVTISILPNSATFGINSSYRLSQDYLYLFIYYKFCIKTTLSYFLHVNNRQKFNRAFNAFLGDNNHDFDTLRSHLNYFFDKDSVTYQQIVKCNNVLEF